MLIRRNFTCSRGYAARACHPVGQLCGNCQGQGHEAEDGSDDRLLPGGAVVGKGGQMATGSGERKGEQGGCGAWKFRIEMAEEQQSAECDGDDASRAADAGA